MDIKKPDPISTKDLTTIRWWAVNDVTALFRFIESLWHAGDGEEFSIKKNVATLKNRDDAENRKLLDALKQNTVVYIKHCDARRSRGDKHVFNLKKRL